jgi:hypothetical protein
MRFGLVPNFDGCFFDTSFFFCFGKFCLVFFIDIGR